MGSNSATPTLENKEGAVLIDTSKDEPSQDTQKEQESYYSHLI